MDYVDRLPEIDTFSHDLRSDRSLDIRAFSGKVTWSSSWS